MLWNDRLPICCFFLFFFWQIRVMRISLELPPPPPSSLPLSLSLSDGVFPLESLPSVFWSIWRTLTALEDFYKIDSLDLKLLRPAVSQCQSLLQTHYKHHLYTVNINATCSIPTTCPAKQSMFEEDANLLAHLSNVCSVKTVWDLCHFTCFSI